MPLIGLAFFLSGFAALLYEVLWVRLLALYFGSTTLAASAVLAAYMAGLALGSLLGGRAADRLGARALLLAFAGLELGTGVLGLLTRPLIPLLGGALLSMGLLEAPASIQGAAYFSASLLLLLLPTTLMGATLPVLTRWAGLSRKEGFDKPFSLLYGLNTLGAVLGAASAGFFLIAVLGPLGTLGLAAALNAAAALLAWQAGRSLKDGPPLPAADPSPPRALIWRPAAPIFLSGAAAMVCEVAWTRAFAQVLGSSTFAFTVMLATVLAGLALGGLLFHAFRPRLRPGLLGLGLLLALTGLLIRLEVPLFNFLPYAMARLYPFLSQGWLHAQAAGFLLCASIMILPALLMGASLPWALAAAEPEERRIGSAAGTCYSLNTAGAILGSALGGLVLIPWLGAERALGAAAWLYLAGAGLAFLLSSRTAPLRALCAASAAALMAEAALVCPAWEPRAVSSGAYLYGKAFEGVRSYRDFLRRVRNDALIFYRDGPIAAVAVLEGHTGERFLRINGKTDASLGRDLATQLLTGYLPLLMHPGSPSRGLVIGLGSGASAAAMTSAAGMAAVDVIEIEPAVTQAAAFFEKANLGVLRDPRVRVVHADARQFLAAPGPLYDAIGSEPSNPWVAGVAGLYTQEAFLAARARLAEDGVFCQWLHSYRMGLADFKMILKTFCSVFPHAMLFSNGGNDFFLLGSRRPWSPDLAKVAAFYKDNGLFRRDLPGARAAFEKPYGLLASTFRLTDAELRLFSEGAQLNTDDRPRLEFSAPRWMLAGQNRLIHESMARFKRTALPEGLRGFKETAATRALLHAVQGEAYLESGSTDEAEQAFQRALKADPRCAEALVGLGRLLEDRKQDAQALRRYQDAVRHAPASARAKFYLGAFLLHLGRSAEGRRQLEAGLKLAPADPMGCLHLGISLLSEGRREEAVSLVRAALERPIADASSHENLVILLRAAGE
ncbi:MAG TPA: hypothetical protein DCM05_05500 [Elusimicrobia bacterium]|nr:hypothetical protein [Elusimicrobiota bacterium]